jgi:hypothetical protein
MRWVLRHHHVYEIVGEGGVQVHDDGKIGLYPGWIGGALIRVNTSTEVLPTMIAGGLHIENVNIGFWLIKLYKIWNKESNIP